ncbi:MAG: glycosyltransferase family 4 protein [Chloroflexi bacterium]|nr:MAG: glycosyltransferase family 4 protein [Chloroflexota bacterium]
MRPRVVHVIHSSAFGGGPNMLTLLVTNLRDQFDMQVISDGQGDMPARLKKLSIPMHRMALTTKWSFTGHIPQLGRLMRSLKPDLVHLHGQFAGSLGQLALTVAARPPSLYTVQWPSYLDDSGPWSRLRNHSAERLSCGAASAVVAISEYDRRELIARKLCDPGKLSVIPNAYYIDGDWGGPAGAGPRKLIGFVGRLVDQKGCEFLIRAAPRVIAVHRDVRFLIIGDGPERARLEALARETGAAGAVEFAGYRSDPSTLMQTMAVLAVPSVYEPLGMVAIEAMACGVPVVASAVGGLPEVVENGNTGILVPPRDPEALAAALIRLLDSPQRARQMGSKGRERATREFSPKVIGERYADLYRRLAASTSS